MDIDAILKALQALGLSPLEILTVVGIVVVYRKNEQLFAQVLQLQHSLDECVGKIRPGEPSKPG